MTYAALLDIERVEIRVFQRNPAVMNSLKSILAVRRRMRSILKRGVHAAEQLDVKIRRDQRVPAVSPLDYDDAAVIDGDGRQQHALAAVVAAHVRGLPARTGRSTSRKNRPRVHVSTGPVQPVGRAQVLLRSSVHMNTLAPRRLRRSALVVLPEQQLPSMAIRTRSLVCSSSATRARRRLRHVDECGGCLLGLWSCGSDC